jgi:aryl-alcohol dehydrogenase-like predicted oxidoreductase
MVSGEWSVVSDLFKSLTLVKLLTTDRSPLTKKLLMKYVLLGKSSLRVSTIGFGCMSLTDNATDNGRLIHRALELGINFFDTADMYAKGMNEVMLGKILGDRRQQCILATKVGNQWRSDGSGWDWNPRKEYIMESVEKSLGRLQTDHIDLYQLHGGTLEDPIDETIEAFERLQEQGKIRYYGISSIRPSVIREYIRLSGIVSVMMQYGILDRRPEESCLTLLKDNGIGVLARGSLSKGLLVDKPAVSWLNYTAEQVDHASALVGSLSGESFSRSPAQTALRFALQNPAISAAVTGFRTLVQLEDAAAAPDAPPLTEASLQSLRNAVPVNYYEQHR